MIWGGFGEVFAIPLDLTVGEGPWAHLPAADYVRTRDHYPAEPGVFRRGDGDWGIFDAWNRPRPEVWHVHGMYSPIRITADAAGADGGRLAVALENRFAHRSLEGLDIRVSGGRVEDGGGTELTARPGETERLVLRREPGAEAVRLEVWHPEGWLVDGGEWPWPGAAPAPRDAVLERAAPVSARPLGTRHARVERRGSRVAAGLAGAPRPRRGHAARPGPAARGPTAGTSWRSARTRVRAPLAGWDWEGTVTARIEDRTLVFEYECTYLGGRAFNAKEVGLTLRPSRDLVDLWWRRIGDWSAVPARPRRADVRLRARGRRHQQRAQPGADLGAGRDARRAATTTAARSGASSSPAPPTAARR